MIASGQEQNAAKDGLVSMTERIMLGIESSCDDTSIAILKGQQLLGQFAAVQHIHSKYGGVVPEFASRAHQVHIVPSSRVRSKKRAAVSVKSMASPTHEGPACTGHFWLEVPLPAVWPGRWGCPCTRCTT